MKTRVILYLLGGVLILGSGISSAMTDGASGPEFITIACGVLILALAGWQFRRSYGADSSDRDNEPPHRP